MCRTRCSRHMSLVVRDEAAGIAVPRLLAHVTRNTSSTTKAALKRRRLRQLYIKMKLKLCSEKGNKTVTHVWSALDYGVTMQQRSTTCGVEKGEVRAAEQNKSCNSEMTVKRMHESRGSKSAECYRSELQQTCSKSAHKISLKTYTFTCG